IVARKISDNRSPESRGRVARTALVAAGRQALDGPGAKTLANHQRFLGLRPVAAERLEHCQTPRVDHEVRTQQGIRRGLMIELERRSARRRSIAETSHRFEDE